MADAQREAYSTSIWWCAVLVGALLGSTVYAQDTEDFDLWSNLSEKEDFDPEPTAEADDDDWFVRIGVLGGVAPEYLGSDKYELAYAPDVKITWRDRVFLRGRKFGINVYRNGRIRSGVYVRYSGGRSDSNEGLNGLGDVDKTITGGVFLNYRYKVLRFKSEIRHDLLSNDQGTMVLASVGSKFPVKDPMFSFSVGGTWVSGEYMESFYGITGRQSVRSGIRQ